MLNLREKVLLDCDGFFLADYGSNTKKYLCLVKSERLPHKEPHEAFYAGNNLPEGWVRHPYIIYQLAAMEAVQ